MVRRVCVEALAGAIIDQVRIGPHTGAPFMGIELLFPTLVYRAPLRAQGTRATAALNARLLRECQQLRVDDLAGRRWSARHYRNGYTSYGSAHRMQRLSPTFAALARGIDAHVARFARTLEFALGTRKLAMTDCWVNIMGRGAVHGLHLHPLSTLSGVYYVAVPAGAPGLKLEDPRLERFMAAPPRARAARRRNRPWVTIAARPGQVVLFESWLRHEVLPHRGPRERVSISFNYSWF
jgi:uncharacterized protein (TIGR02466 family)